MKKNRVRLVGMMIVMLFGGILLLKKSMLFCLKDSIFTTLKIAGETYFPGVYRKEWKHGQQPTKNEKRMFKKMLGYDPKIEHIIDTNAKDVINHNRPTLYFHGFGDMKNSAKLFKVFTDALPGDIITFHFPDWGPGIPWITRSSLGQIPDVQAALVALKWAKDTLQLDAIDLFGYSRGGATILNMIAVLHDKTKTFDAELQAIGIDEHERKALLNIIEKGSIVLNAPLRDMNVTTKKFLGIIEPVVKPVLVAISKYDPKGLQGASSAEKFEGLKLNILLHFQNRDKIVFNKGEADLYRKLYQHNPDTTYLVLGDDGGHIHSQKALSNAIHTFRKKFGGSYDPEYVARYEETTPDDISGRLLQPTSLDVKEVIRDYYASRPSRWSTFWH